MSTDVSKDLEEELRAYIKEAVESGQYTTADDVLRKALELLREHAKRSASAGEKRSGGQWKGKVMIGLDFDDLPDDLAESFGSGDRNRRVELLGTIAAALLSLVAVILARLPIVMATALVGTTAVASIIVLVLTTIPNSSKER